MAGLYSYWSSTHTGGGAGIVIVRYLPSKGTLTATGTYSTATDGSYTVVIYTGNGTFKLA